MSKCPLIFAAALTTLRTKQLEQRHPDCNTNVLKMTDALKDPDHVDGIIKLVRIGVSAWADMMARDELNNNRSSSSSEPSRQLREQKSRLVLSECARNSRLFEEVVDGDQVIDFKTVGRGLLMQIIGNYTVATIANYLADGVVQDLPTVQQGNKKGMREWFIHNGMYFEQPPPLT